VSPTFGTDASGRPVKITKLLTSSIFDAFIYSSGFLHGLSFLVFEGGLVQKLQWYECKLKNFLRCKASNQLTTILCFFLSGVSGVKIENFCLHGSTVRGWFWELLTFVLVSGFLILVDW
jgi:hypothetical protein